MTGGWDDTLDDLAARRAAVHAMGGEEKVERQHHFGKYTVRERIDKMADDGSWDEVGTLAGRGEYDAEGRLVDFRPSNFVFGTAEIDQMSARASRALDETHAGLRKDGLVA